MSATATRLYVTVFLTTTFHVVEPVAQDRVPDRSGEGDADADEEGVEQDLVSTLWLCSSPGPDVANEPTRSTTEAPATYASARIWRRSASTDVR